MKNPPEGIVKEYLKKCFLFSQLSNGELDEVIAISKYEDADKNNMIFLKDLGEPDQMYVILEGSVRISRSSEEGREITLDTLGTADIFGEISLFDGGMRTADAMATEKSRFLVIHRHDLIFFLENHFQVAIKLLAAISRKLRATDVFLEDVLLRKLSERLAKKLLSLAETQGQPLLGNQVRITQKYSHQKLGRLMNATRESVCRQMRAWETRQQIMMDQGYIVIKDIEAFNKANCQKQVQW